MSSTDLVPRLGRSGFVSFICLVALFAAGCPADLPPEGESIFLQRDGAADDIATDLVANRDVASSDSGLGANDVGEEVGVDVHTDGEPDSPTGDTGGDGEPAFDAAPDGDAETSPCFPDQCDIDGQCVDNGEANPENPCEICLVLAADDEWSADDTGLCDDGDLCTTGDTCFEGTCMGTITRCDDGNPCTASVCDPDTGGCVSEPAAGACSDGDPCTVGDSCVAGACRPGADTPSCDDGNVCTSNRCEPGVGCVAEPADGVACDDGDVCSIGDVCADGRCQAGSERPLCDDDDLCTVDWCDPVEGCVTSSVADLCADDNPCTDEVCDPERGCVYPFNDDSCDDGLTCTSADVCSDGRCCGTPVATEDFNACTDDFCVEPGGVANVPNSDPCDDGDVCTVGDMCVDGGCVAGTTPRLCADDNICTDDLCDPVDGCTFPNNDEPCDDGDQCTVGDVCADGGCVAGATPLQCVDDNDCTIDRCDSDAGCVFELVASNACRPAIVIDYPPRAATILDDGGGAITVSGTVASGAGPIESFSVNGAPAPVGVDGSFAVVVDPTVGGNFLIVEAVDSFGSRRRVVQSYLFSPVFAVPDAVADTGHADEGLGYYLGDEALGALASVLGLALGGLDLSGLLPNPVLSSFGHMVRARGSDPIDIGTPTATLDSRTTGIHINAVIPNLVARLTVSGWACNGDVDYTASNLTVNAAMVPSVVDNQLVTELRNVDAVISGGSINFSCFLGALIELLVGDVSSDFETAIEDSLGSELGPLLGEAFSAFAVTFPLSFPSIDPEGEPIAITLATDFRTVRTDNDGANLGLRALASSETRTPYVNLGVAGRASCGEPPQRLAYFEEDPLEVVLGDDAVNQLLWGAWNGGLLEFDVPPDLIGDEALLGVAVTDLDLTASGMLQPTVSDCGGEGALAHIGDLRIDASMNFGDQPLDAIIFASLAAAFEIGASEGELSFAITSIERVELEVQVLDEELVALESAFEALLRENLVPGLLGALGGDALGGIPLPEIDVSDAIDGIPAGTVIQITPGRVRRLSGNSVVGGVLEVRE